MEQIGSTEAGAILYLFCFTDTGHWAATLVEFYLISSAPDSHWWMLKSAGRNNIDHIGLWPAPPRPKGNKQTLNNPEMNYMDYIKHKIEVALESVLENWT